MIGLLAYGYLMLYQYFHSHILGNLAQSLLTFPKQKQIPTNNMNNYPIYFDTLYMALDTVFQLLSLLENLPYIYYTNLQDYYLLMVSHLLLFVLHLHTYSNLLFDILFLMMFLLTNHYLHFLLIHIHFHRPKFHQFLLDAHENNLLGFLLLSVLYCHRLYQRLSNLLLQYL